MTYPQRVYRENDNASARIHYAGDCRARSRNENLPTFTIETFDAETGGCFRGNNLTIPALRLLRAVLGELLGEKDHAAQVVEVRIVHEAAPLAAAGGEQPRDSERGELDAIKTEMRRPAK